jgi:hypothetical protein
MANESIQVIYEPLGSFLGMEYYHETLEYTNSAGQEFFATSGPTASPSGNALYNVTQAASAAATSGGSAYGTLFCVAGTQSQVSSVIGPGNFDSQTSVNDDRVVVASGSNLSSQWNAITTVCSQVNSEGLSYSPLTQNSNSVASTELTAAGLSPPKSGFFSADWAPASGNILPTPETGRSDNQTVDASTSNGELDVTISESNEDVFKEPVDTLLTLTADPGHDTGYMQGWIAGGSYGAFAEQDNQSNGNWTDVINGTTGEVNGPVAYETIDSGADGKDTAATVEAGAFDGDSVTVTVNGTADIIGVGDFIRCASGDWIHVAGGNDTIVGNDLTISEFGINAGDVVQGSSDTIRDDTGSYSGYGGGFLGSGYTGDGYGYGYGYGGIGGS